jgi:hypothetical protein
MIENDAAGCAGKAKYSTSAHSVRGTKHRFRDLG